MNTSLRSPFAALLRPAHIALTAVVLALGFAARAAEAPVKTFDIPPGRALVTLKQFVEQSGAQLLYSADEVEGINTNAAKGRLQPRRALQLMLADTGLESAEDPATGTITVHKVRATGRRSTAAPTAEVGTVAGLVSNAGTRTNLEGAVITVVELGRRVLSDPSGRFQLSNLPAGTYTLLVSYTGLDSRQEQIEVRPGQTSLRNVELTSQIYELESFVVTGDREGNALSITKQRNATNVMNVVATDTYGNVSEGNLGNFMQRLPGVGTNEEVGDITGIIIRGTPPGWSAVNVDGTRASSANASSGIAFMGRGTVIDQIPADFIKEIELTKAPTPDMPADSIGGTANLVTHSALDIKGNRLSYRAGANVNTYRRKDRNLTPNASVTYLGKFGSRDQFGLALSASYVESNNTRDRIQLNRNNDDGFTSQARTLDDDITRIRSGLSLKFDYDVTENTRLRAGVSYSDFDFDQWRTDWDITSVARVADYNVVSRAAIEGGAIPRATNNQTAGIAPGHSVDFSELLNANFNNLAGRETRVASSYKYEVSGETKLPGDQKLNYGLNYSPSEYVFIFQSMLVNLNNRRVGLAVDSRADRLRPVYTQTMGQNIEAGADMSAVTFARLQSNERYSKERVTGARLDYSKEFTQVRTAPLFKAGADWRRQYRSLDTYFPRWQYTTPTGGTANVNVTPFVSPTAGYGLFNNKYPRRDQLDFAAFFEEFNTNPDRFVEFQNTVTSGLLENNATEDVFAAYAMGSLRMGPVTALGGVRYEHTAIEALGSLNDPRNPDVGTTTREGDYDDLFPSLHFKYEPRRGLILRASVSTGMARPAHNDLFPNTTISYDDETGSGLIVQNNPALLPQKTTNYDASIEYYFQSVGVLSAGYFEKHIEDFLGREDQTIGSGAGNGFEGDFEGFTLRTTRNFGAATIKGFELNYNQQLTMLPGLLNTLGVFANYTKLETKGQYDGETDELAQFIPEMYNVGLSWSYKGWAFSAKYRNQSGYLRTFNANPLFRERTLPTKTWDFNVKYKWSQRLSFYADVVNAFNHGPSWYRGPDTSRISMSEVFGARVSFGVSGSF